MNTFDLPTNDFIINDLIRERRTKYVLIGDTYVV